MKKEFKIPSIIGLVLLIASTVGGIYLTSSPISFNTRASGDCQPNGVQITNVTDHSVNISFTTSSDCEAVINLNQRTFSDIKSGRIHYFYLDSLSPSTQHNFKIISGGKSFSESSYQFSTALTPPGSLPTSNLAWGKVYNSDGKTPANAIVYLSIPGASLLSSVVTSDGNWSVSLANSLNESKTDWFTPPSDPVNEDIIVLNIDGSTTQIVNTTAVNNPVPDIVIGQNSLNPPSVTNQPSQTGQLGDQSHVATEKDADILNPKDGDIFNTTNPDFFGTAPLNSHVIIEVHSSVQINGETVADQSGSWHWSSTQSLDPGQHTITIKVQDPTTGIWKSITRSFTVLAAESSNLSYEASSSATITPTTLPTIILPSPTLMETPTNIPTERAAHPSVSVTPPVTGNPQPTLILLVGALLLLVLSVRFIL